MIPWVEIADHTLTLLHNFLPHAVCEEVPSPRIEPFVY